MNLLQELFGHLHGPQVPQADPNAQVPPQAAPQQVPPPEQAAINVAAPEHRNREGLLGGVFGVGRTGGNILGILGDALLAQSGHGPVYAPRLQRAREAEALDGLADDPLTAIKRMARVNPTAARDMYNKYSDDNRLDHAQSNLNEGIVYNRVLSMLGTANERNYPAVKKWVQQYASSKGVNLPFDLPDVYDPEAVKGLRNAGMTPAQQASNEETSDYHDEMMGYRRDNLDERTNYHGKTLGERVSHDHAIEATANARERRQAASGGGKPKAMTVQTKTGAVTFNADKTLAQHTDANGVQVRMKKVGNRWMSTERILPSASGGTHQYNVNGTWVTKEAK